MEAAQRCRQFFWISVDEKVGYMELGRLLRPTLTLARASCTFTISKACDISWKWTREFAASSFNTSSKAAKRVGIKVKEVPDGFLNLPSKLKLWWSNPSSALSDRARHGRIKPYTHVPWRDGVCHTFHSSGEMREWMRDWFKNLAGSGEPSRTRQSPQKSPS